MKDVISKLPSMEHSFEIQTKGQETGINWVGKFKYCRPTLGARSKIDVLQKKLNGDMTTIDEETRLFNEAISHLRYTLVDYPDWWKDSGLGVDLFDGNVVGEIYNKCMDFEMEWQKKVFSGDIKSIITEIPDVVDEHIS
jgi:hypothetical protein